MCQYIKDNDEQCGMDDEPFCHHHDETEQAELHALGQEMFDGGDMPTGAQFAQLISKAVDAHSAPSESDSIGIETNAECDDCGSTVRRTERLSQHPHSPRRMVFEAIAECDCGEFVITHKGVQRRKLPDGWTE